MKKFKHLFSFSGRASRKTYWFVMSPAATIVLMPGFILRACHSDYADLYVNLSTLIVLWPVLAVQIKRWHDIDKSAWWMLIHYIPAIGLLVAIVMNGLLEGTKGSNRFG